MEVCYRHPGRETGVACSNCGRPICPDCMTTTSVGMRCPECAKQKTKVKTMATVEQPTLTYVLIGICVALAFGAVLSGDARWGGAELRADFGVSRAEVGEGEVWRVLTSGFLHDGPFHLMLNMVALYFLGTLLEPALGRLRFALVYFVSILTGSLGVVLLEPQANAVGASTAIFGLLGAAVVFMWRRGINPMETGIGLWLGLNLLITFTVPGISIGGHVGGLAGGALVMYILSVPRRLPVPAPLIAGAIGLVSVLGAVAVSA